MDVFCEQGLELRGSCFEELDFAHFRQMEALEESSYPSCYIASAEEAFSWYRERPHSVIAACEGERVVGFVNLLPVSLKLYGEILAGTFNDARMRAEDILSHEQCLAGPFALFLSCIVLEDRMRGKGIARRLLGKALAPYLSADMRCSCIATDNVTAEGARFSEGLGFSLICESDHGTRVYARDIEGLAKVLDSSTGSDCR